MIGYLPVALLLSFCFSGCNSLPGAERETGNLKTETEQSFGSISFDTSLKTIHVFVALCDNRYQGIVIRFLLKLETGRIQAITYTGLWLWDKIIF
jgi:hypothetical protein